MPNIFSTCFSTAPNLQKLTYYSFFTTVFLIGSVDSLAGITVLIAAITAIMRAPSSFRILRSGAFFTKIYIYTSSAFLFIVVLNMLLGRANFGWYAFSLTFILTFTIALVISKYSADSGKDLYKMIAHMAGAHAFFLTAIGFSQVFIFHIDRAHSSINANIFSPILATSCGIFAVYLFQSTRNSPVLKNMSALLVWLLLIIFSVHLTGTRGVIIAFIPMLLGMLIICLKDLKKGDQAPIIIILTIAFAFLMFLILSSERFGLGVNEVMLAAEGYHNQGSVGLRVDMWAEAIRLIIERPLTGHGLVHFSEIHNLPDSSSAKNFVHAHNQYLDIWMKAGLGGLLFLLIFLSLPMFVGWRLLTRNIEPGVGLTLIWLGGSFSVFGLTDVFLSHTNTIVPLVTYIPMLLIIADKKIADTN